MNDKELIEKKLKGMTIAKTAEDSPMADGVFEVSITTLKYLYHNKMDLRFVGWTPP
jgi:hypothetical protein